MGPISAVRSVLAKGYDVVGYFDFEGRASRSEFWWWTLVRTLVLLAISLPALFVFDGPTASEQAWRNALFIAFGVIFLVTIIPNLSVTVRRLHDSNRSGWWVLPLNANIPDPTPPLIFWPIIALSLVALGFLIMPGTKGKNRFDPIDTKALAKAVVSADAPLRPSSAIQRRARRRRR